MGLELDPEVREEAEWGRVVDESTAFSSVEVEMKVEEDDQAGVEDEEDGMADEEDATEGEEDEEDEDEEERERD